MKSSELKKKAEKPFGGALSAGGWSDYQTSLRVFDV